MKKQFKIRHLIYLKTVIGHLTINLDNHNVNLSPVTCNFLNDDAAVKYFMMCIITLL